MPLNRWNKGDPLSSSHLNEGWDTLSRLIGVNNGSFPNYDFSSNIDPKNVYVKSFLGKITNTPPTFSDAPASYSNETYWVKIQVVNNTDGTSVDGITNADWQKVTLGNEDIPNHLEYDDTTPNDTVAVTNLCEMISHSHLIPVNTIVEVFEFESHMQTSNGRQNIKYVMSLIPPDIEARVTSSSGGPLIWSYTCSDGTNTYSGCYNRMEESGDGTTGYIEGSPGSLGVNVGSDGTVGSTTCKVQPMGPNCPEMGCNQLQILFHWL